MRNKFENLMHQFKILKDWQAVVIGYNGRPACVVPDVDNKVARLHLPEGDVHPDFLMHEVLHCVFAAYREELLVGKGHTAEEQTVRDICTIISRVSESGLWWRS